MAKKEIDPRLKGDKGNKLKVGDKVIVNQRVIDWFSGHFVWGLGRKTNDPGYCPGEKEIGHEDMGHVFMWSKAKLSGKSPVGTVTGFGAKDEDKGSVNRKYVLITFSMKTKFGTIKDTTYVSENDLKRVSKRK